MDISVSLVSRLIAAQFPQWADLSITPVKLGGWDNRTFCLGDDMTVRLPSHKEYEAQVGKEQKWLPKLAPKLPLPIPTPLGLGVPTDEYPLGWSIYRWIEGENATVDRIDNVNEFAIQLAEFLNALQRIDASDGPTPGEHNFYRGGPLRIYDKETRQAIAELGLTMNATLATEVWEWALSSTWKGPGVWVHGDIYPTNLLVKDGHLHAVIDFGCCGVGDPACDLTIAWTFFSGESRSAFRSHLRVDDEAFRRACGWALWKALITIANPSDAPPGRMKESYRVIEDVMTEYKQQRESK